MTRWIMCCPGCKAHYAYTTDPSQKPEWGKVPVAQSWSYMDGQTIQPGALFYCAECNRHFHQPMINDVIEETNYENG